jgi:murein DD-endopeptidase MepM/ murein hydrolase activator NlpD
MKALKSKLPKLQKQYRSDLKSDDPKVRAVATIVAIIDLTAMRVGNDDSVDEFGTFGASTLQKKHVKVSGNTVNFKFMGKKQVSQSFKLTDAAVAKNIKDLLKGKTGNDFVFEYEEDKRIRAKVVNRYLANFDITAKDLRGFHANRLMREELKRNKDFESALENVAEEVGHEPKTLMNQYLDPKLVAIHKKAGPIIDFINAGFAKLFSRTNMTGPAPARAPVVPTNVAPKTAPAAATPRTKAVKPHEHDHEHGARITSPWGPRTHPVTGEKNKDHKGIDLNAPYGEKTMILASDDGTVVTAKSNEYNGNYVNLQHIDANGNKFYTMYLHLSKIMVKEGQRVARGDLLGLAGDTGLANAVHLHFALKIDGEFENPTEYMKDFRVIGGKYAG